MTDSPSTVGSSPARTSEIAFTSAPSIVSLPTTPRYLRVEQLYSVQDQTGVRAFLSAHPFLIDVLFSVHPEIRKVFPASPLHLEVFTDPEDPTWVQLMLVIVPTGSIEETLDREEQLDAWWVTAGEPAQGLLLILADYR